MKNRQARQQIVAGYDEMIEEYIIGGYQPFFLNFMFNQIPTSNGQRLDIMVSEVTRVHEILCRHSVRKPKSEEWRFLRPIFIGCHDLPVWKRDKTEIMDFLINGGLHFNAIALVRPPARTDMHKKVQELLMGKQSRLTVPLDEHFRTKAKFYHNAVLARIHTTPITYGTMSDYMLKTFKHGRVGPDSIQVWK
ncbi:hypothetical protein [Bradyrhizobium sp. CCGUVB14]|uniref:hypothetical protein n=1 Tax=Bradyrhizobium sp. CCGUVB14 TaxID=2949628 RepID=UPI0020B1AFD2|nr:hypothetical protein [Bradyrhizobium sp. CCGUVB14]MCP3446192.1 hypothetical protein [Bradyrhizobium sp. CCGUVB14]